MQQGINRTQDMLFGMREYIKDCKPSALSRNKISVDRDTLLSMIDDIFTALPDEFQRCVKICSQKQVILTNAREEQARIIEEGRQQAAILVDETEVVQSAYAKANEIINSAKAEAASILKEAQNTRDIINNGILEYAEEKFSTIINSFQKAFEETRDASDSLLTVLDESLDIAKKNRDELMSSFADAGKEPSRKDDEIVASMNQSGDEVDFTEEDFAN